MTELDAILKAVCENPHDDTPRLCYADAVEDTDPARAEYVRIGVQLARWDCTFKQTPEQPGWKHNCGADENGYWLCQPMRSRERELIMSKAALEWRRLPWGSAPREAFRRGFLSALTCSWSDFLRVADALIWRPWQRCPVCKDGFAANYNYVTSRWVKVKCTCCKKHGGTGRVPRPFPPTAQPITIVTLTAADIHTEGSPDWLRLPGGTGVGIRFDRVKCPTCDGLPPRIISDPHKHCPDCHGIPLNLWTCEKWPTVRFVMPAAVRVEGIEGWARRAGQTVRVTGTIA